MGTKGDETTKRKMVQTKNVRITNQSRWNRIGRNPDGRKQEEVATGKVKWNSKEREDGKSTR